MCKRIDRIQLVAYHGVYARDQRRESKAHVPRTDRMHVCKMRIVSNQTMIVHIGNASIAPTNIMTPAQSIYAPMVNISKIQLTKCVQHVSVYDMDIRGSAFGCIWNVAINTERDTSVAPMLIGTNGVRNNT